MNKLKLKSKKGFTLIELLVVIGILAVLAAIAIPTVTGLIDRANVSADKTNSNEMTNAIERFASEYELYRQDIASGKIKSAYNLDSTQARVYQVTQALMRQDIEALESKDGYNGINIDKTTKYPLNLLSTKKVIECYVKNTSSLFEPKQSNAHYYYSPACGVVVAQDTTKADPLSLNALVPSGLDASGQKLDSTTVWIDLTLGVGQMGNEEGDSNRLIHKNGVYTIAATGETRVGNGIDVYFPLYSKQGDVYNYGDYTYSYSSGWKVSVSDKTKTSYGNILSSVNAESITELYRTFEDCKNMTTAPAIPLTVTNMNYTYQRCSSLVSPPTIPNSVKKMYYVFSECTSLTSAPKLPNGIIDLTAAFFNCKNLITPPVIPNGVTNLDKTFYGSGITTAPNIPSSVNSMFQTFCKADKMATTPVLSSNVTSYEYTFFGCKSLKTAPVFPEGTLKLEKTFSYCYALTDIPELPSTIQNMDETFMNCVALTSMPKIPSSVTSMKSTFLGCTAMTTVPYAIPDSVTDMTSTFEKCSKLKNITSLPNNIATLNRTFYDCRSLKSIVIPNRVTTLDNAFYNCVSMQNIYIPASVTTVTANNFERLASGVYGTSTIYCQNETVKNVVVNSGVDDETTVVVDSSKF